MKRNPMNHPSFVAWALVLVPAGMLLMAVELPAQEGRGLKKSPTNPTASAMDSKAGEGETGQLQPQVSDLPYQVALLDRVHLTLPGGEQRTLQVSQEGTLEMEGAKTKVVGLSRQEVSRLVKSKFPQATRVEIEEFRPNRISVLGEVFHQLNSELADGPMRVMDAIAAANGFTPLANQRRVKLVRQNAGRVEVYELDLREMMKGENLKQNLLLRPGDVITVPRNFL